LLVDLGELSYLGNLPSRDKLELEITEIYDGEGNTTENSICRWHRPKLMSSYEFWFFVEVLLFGLKVLDTGVTIS